MVYPLRKITTQTTASPIALRTLMDHKAQQNSFCLGFFSPIIMACKEIYNGDFLHPPPAAHNWLNAKEVIYFKEIIKGVKS